jgi:hypothetical protein
VASINVLLINSNLSTFNDQKSLHCDLGNASFVKSVIGVWSLAKKKQPTSLKIWAVFKHGPKKRLLIQEAAQLA